MNRVFCDQDDVDLTVRINHVKIQYGFYDDGDEKLWTLIFCDNMCASVYFGNRGREDMLKNEQV